MLSCFLIPVADAGLNWLKLLRLLLFRLEERAVGGSSCRCDYIPLRSAASLGRSGQSLGPSGVTEIPSPLIISVAS